uniref:Orofacial cleft 1 candidate gene 1 protein n=1 Tax=Oncorhynchus kisutch TaxID=8019 RepID=A0A8C7KMI8_ONCKI
IHLTISLQKLQQKALQQPKQKKSKSAEFLMGGMEESAVVEGIENPVFDGSYSTELSASQASTGREIQRDRQDSTLAAHQQKMELRAPAKPREIMNQDEKGLYQKMAEMLDADDDITIIELPGIFSTFQTLKTHIPFPALPALITNDIRMCCAPPPPPNLCSPQQKKPINKINSSSAHVRGSAAPPPLLQGQADKQETAAPAAASSEKRENLWAKEMEEYTFSLHGSNGGAAERTHLALRMIPSELGLSPRRWGWRSSSAAAAAAQLCLIMPLLALIWFARLYLHYCSQWLFLQAIAVPVNKFQFHAHTVELVYQNSLLHTREELAMVVVGPLTLNAVTLLLLLIRWGCQLAFGSLPSFTSNFIMALGVWTVLDPLAVFVVDAVLGRLSYSAESPVADAAKLYWHFYRTDQSGAAGVVITLFLYAILFLLSTTILYLYFLRLHNEGRMLDIFQRLSVTEGSFFVPRDLEVSNQELDYIIQKAEQWRGFNGERRKVSVYDYIWTEEGPLAGCAPPRGDPHGAVPAAGGESSTHVSVYTLYLSGQHHRYRHFLRQPDGAILELPLSVFHSSYLAHSLFLSLL